MNPQVDLRISIRYAITQKRNDTFQFSDRRVTYEDRWKSNRMRFGRNTLRCRSINSKPFSITLQKKLSGTSSLTVVTPPSFFLWGDKTLSICREILNTFIAVTSGYYVQYRSRRARRGEKWKSFSVFDIVLTVFVAVTRRCTYSQIVPLNNDLDKSRACEEAEMSRMAGVESNRV